MLVAGANFTNTAKRANRASQYDQQAYNVARAGLVDAMSWFKRQGQQPVVAFRPVRNTTNLLKGDTNDPWNIDPGPTGGYLDPSDAPRGRSDDKPCLGIVQDYPLDLAANLWCRYEIGKLTRVSRGAAGQAASMTILQKDRSGTLVSVAESAANSNEWEGVEDVTANYGLQGQGLVWRIVSHGYVYFKDPANTNANVRFYQYPNKVLADITLETEIYRLQVKDWLPDTMSTMALTYIRGNAVFDTSRPLNGGGILVVEGNLTLDVDASDSFTGLIYCTGNYIQRSPSLVTGAVYAKGSVNVTASGTEDCFIEYNQDLLNEVRRQLGQYRERRSAARVLN